MLKVFLVEDESVMREGLRDNIPWQQCGYRFVGEAADGEMALPLIRKVQPDVLITDIKMPFMDGLSLSRIVHEEFPNTKIIILSGHDDFEYARQAIQIGVEQYLLKPVTRAALQKVLFEIREKIENEQEQVNYKEQFRDELHEYEQFNRRYFFEQMLGGKLSVQEIYDEAKKLSLEINASWYNLVLFSVQPKGYDAQNHNQNDDMVSQQEEILRYFLRFPEYILFRVNINTYGLLVKGDESEIKDLTQKCISNIRRICESVDSSELDWYVAVGEPVERLSMLPECFSQVNHIFSYRFIVPGVNVLSQDIVSGNTSDEESGNYRNIELDKIDPEIIKGFLFKGDIEEVDDFISNYLGSLSEALKSKVFRNYLTLNIRFLILAFLDDAGVSKKDFTEKVDDGYSSEYSVGMEELESYIGKMIRTAINLRDNQSNSQSKRIIRRAVDYIDDNFTDEDISLNAVSEYVDVSSNYFSAIFSSEMKQTFVEYVTNKRMDKAKKLLKQTQMHTGEIAAEVGYKDPHYFSFVFKKTQGMTPREYRNGKEE